jgi:hypothetical protein
LWRPWTTAQGQLAIQEVEAYINYLLARTRSLLVEPGAWEQVVALARAPWSGGDAPLFRTTET